MASMLDRGDSYKVQYLGSAMLSQMATGLGVLQRPLRDLYFQFRQACSRAPVQLQERHLMMTDKGMVMSYPGSPDGRRDLRGNAASVEEVYAMPSILFWDAVQFVVVKGHEKKFRAAFEPLDNDHSRNKDNLFSVLDKQFNFLQKQRHPPLFTCVLRRTQGLKALDVHAFVCYSEEEALGLVRALNTVHSSYSTDEQQETGVFGYNPFGKESVRSTAGLEKTFNQQKQAGVVSSVKGDPRHTVDEPQIQHQFILRRPGENVQDLQSHGNASSAPANVRHTHSSRAKSPGRAPPKDYSRFTGSQPNLSASSPISIPGPGPGSSTRTPPQTTPQPPDIPGDRNSRVFLLSQSDFQLNQIGTEEPVSRTSTDPKRKGSVKKPTKTPVPVDTYDYIQHINRTLDKPKTKDTPNTTSAQPRSPVFTKSNSVKKSQSTRAKSQERPVSSRSNVAPGDAQHVAVAFSNGGIFQEDVGGSSERVKTMGQGYSLLSSSQGPPPGYAPHQNSRHPYAPSPTDHPEPRSRSPTYQQTIPRNKEQPPAESPASNISRASSFAQNYDNINKFIAEHRKGNSSAQDRQSSHPSGYPAPIIPPRSPMLGGKSESFRRNMNSQERTPTTKQGTVMAQVTPQTQRGSSIEPFNNSPRVNDRPGNVTASTPNLRTRDGQTGSVLQSSGHSKPIAMVPPHKIQGVKVLPSQPSLSKPKDNPVLNEGHLSRSGHDNMMSRTRSPEQISKDRPSSLFMDNDANSSQRRTVPQHISEVFSNPEKSSPSGDIYALPRKGSQKSKHKQSQSKSKSESTPNWQFQRTPSAKNSSGGAPRENPDKPRNENLLVTQKKDAEIASVMQNIQFDYEGTLSPHAPHRTNFEKSLGYFP